MPGTGLGLWPYSQSFALRHMIKQSIAALAFVTCCLGNPANAATYTANDDVIVNRNRNRTYNVDKDVVKNIDRSTTNIDRRRIDRSRTRGSLPHDG